MSRTRPDISLDQFADSVSLHTPIHIPGFRAYCPVCGIGCKNQREAAACCAKLSDPRKRRIRTGHERIRR